MSFCRPVVISKFVSVRLCLGGVEHASFAFLLDAACRGTELTRDASFASLPEVSSHERLVRSSVCVCVARGHSVVSVGRRSVVGSIFV